MGNCFGCLGCNDDYYVFNDDSCSSFSECKGCSYDCQSQTCHDIYKIDLSEPSGFSAASETSDASYKIYLDKSQIYTKCSEHSSGYLNTHQPSAQPQPSAQSQPSVQPQPSAPPL